MTAGRLNVGIACPYSFDVPGGVQAHIRDLAEALIGLGHQVSVLTPADDEEALPPYVVPAGRAVPVRYNGSVARVAFGPLSVARVRRWLREGGFDVLHVHEPVAPSLSLLACIAARANASTSTPFGISTASPPRCSTCTRRASGDTAIRAVTFSIKGRSTPPNAARVRDRSMAVWNVATIGPSAASSASTDTLIVVGSCRCSTSNVCSASQRRARA